MGNSRKARATRPGTSRFKGADMRLAKFDPAALDDYLDACFDSEKATAANNKRKGTSVNMASYRRRLNRIASTAHAKSLLHLLVWYELECKGPHNARKWHRRVEKLFTADAAEEFPHAFDHLEALWQMNQEEGYASSRVLATRIKYTEHTIYVHLCDFALKKQLVYSVSWLVFLYSLHKELQARPELTQLPAALADTQAVQAQAA